MELSISKKDFLRGLARTHAVADRKSSMPILSNVLLSTDDSGLLRLLATDLYLAVSASVEASIKRPGSVALSARTLFDIVKNLPEGEVKLSVDKNHAVHLRSGKIKFRIPGMPGEDFPPLPSPGEHHLHRARCKCALAADRPHAVLHVQRRHPPAPGRHAVRERRQSGAHGHHRRPPPVQGRGQHRGRRELRMLVPQKGIAELKRLIEDVRSDKKGEKVSLGVATVGGSAFFRGNDVLLSVKLADEQFPALFQGHPAVVLTTCGGRT